MNNITIHGRLTRDPEVKDYQTSKGEIGSMTNFSVAVNRKFGDETDFFNCTCFGKSGQTLAKWFRKGDGIVVSGEMQSRRGKQNEKIIYWNLLVQNWDFAEKKGDGNNGASGAPASAPSAPREEQQQMDMPDSMESIEEDVPF